MIWIVGDSDDLSATYIRWLAERRGLPVVNLREDRLGLDWWFEADSDRVTIHYGEQEAHTCIEGDGAFVRLNPEAAVGVELGIDTQFHASYAQERRSALHFMLDAFACPVINRPSAGRSNASKPFQMTRLAARGFAVPRWLATNNCDEARAFTRDCRNGVIIKACSGLRCHVRRLEHDLFEQMKRGTAPVLLQEYVSGVDVRVHVVGDVSFATRVVSCAIDYRFDSDGVSFSAVGAPGELASLCLSVAASEGLLLAGFDFRVDPNGHWYCLEMNPVPTFLPYEAGGGHPIGDRVVDILAPASRSETAQSPLAQRVWLKAGI